MKTADQLHDRATELFRERTKLQKKVRPDLERIREIERQLARIDAQRAMMAEEPAA